MRRPSPRHSFVPSVFDSVFAAFTIFIVVIWADVYAWSCVTIVVLLSLSARVSVVESLITLFSGGDDTMETLNPFRFSVHVL